MSPHAFKICIILSTCVHLAVLYPRSFLHLIPKQERPSQRIELTYFRSGPIKDVVVKDIKPITVQKEVKPARYPLSNVVKLAEIKTPEVPEPLIVETYTEPKIDLKSEMPEGFREEKGNTADGSSEDDAMLLEGYHLKVREKIKGMLEKNGKRFTREGEVYVKFVISKAGTLKDLVLYKDSGKEMHSLEAIAIKSIKEASPFPPFDSEIEETELSFKIPIRFTLHP